MTIKSGEFELIVTRAELKTIHHALFLLVADQERDIANANYKAPFYPLAAKLASQIEELVRDKASH